jgi:hypothetical protein
MRRNKMNILPNLDKRRNLEPTFSFRLAAAFAAAFIMLATGGAARAQVAPTASSGGGFGLSAGVTGSGMYVQYGERKMVGITGFADLDAMHHLGLEGEARFVQFRQTNDLHFETYSAGVRYRRNIGRFQPYVKGLLGEGFFNFPYNLATGHYMVVTAGGGLDFRLNRSVHIRAADAEWQYWPGFTYGAGTTPMTTLGISAGIRVNIR